MNADTFLENFGHLADAPGGVKKLRQMALQFAVQGKLITQNVKDESADHLVARLESERKRLLTNGASGTAIPTSPVAVDETPFPIPHGWAWVRLGDIGVFIGGGTPSKRNSAFWDGSMPWVSPKDMKQWYIEDATDHVTDAAIEQSSAKLIPTPSLLMVVRGMILAHSFPVAVTKREVTINQDMKALRFAIPETAEYLLRACLAARDRMLIHVERSTHGTCRLSTDDVAQFPIPLPPLAEQQRIVAKVDELMALCDELKARQQERRTVHVHLNNAALDRLTSAENDTDFKPAWTRVRSNFDLLYSVPENVTTLRQAILQLAVKGKLVEQNPDDEPAAVLLKRILEEESAKTNEKRRRKKLAEVATDDAPFTLPTGWAWARFSELGEFGRGKSRHRPRNAPHLYEDGKYPLVQTGDVARSNSVIETYTGMYNDAGLEQSRLWKRGTMCITIAANIADTGILGFDACIPDSVVGFVPSREFPNARYFEYFMRTAKSHLEDFAPSTAQKNINLGILETVLIPLPPLPEIQRVVAKVDNLMALCDELETKLTQQQTDADRLTQAMVAAILDGTVMTPSAEPPIESKTPVILSRLND